MKVELISLRILLAPKNSTGLQISSATISQNVWKKNIGKPSLPRALLPSKEKTYFLISWLEEMVNSILFCSPLIIIKIASVRHYWASGLSLMSANKISLKYRTTSQLILALDSILLPFLKMWLILLETLCFIVERWKNLEILSLEASQVSLALYFQDSSYLHVASWSFDRISFSLAIEPSL